jgi:hypothetical protein
MQLIENAIDHCTVIQHIQIETAADLSPDRPARRLLRSSLRAPVGTDNHGAARPKHRHSGPASEEEELLAWQELVTTNASPEVLRPLWVTCGRRLGKDFVTFSSFGRVRSDVRPV